MSNKKKKILTLTFESQLSNSSFGLKIESPWQIYSA